MEKKTKIILGSVTAGLVVVATAITIPFVIAVNNKDKGPDGLGDYKPVYNKPETERPNDAILADQAKIDEITSEVGGDFVNPEIYYTESTAYSIYDYEYLEISGDS